MCIKAVISCFAGILITLLGTFAPAAIVVDPQMTGASDVIFRNENTTMLVTNPVEDSLTLPESTLIIGENNLGVLFVTGNSTISSGGLHLGEEFGSKGELILAGGTVQADGPMVIGHRGAGLLELSDGAQVNSTWLTRIAQEPGSTGEVVVRQPGTIWNVRHLDVGGFPGGGVGSLRILEGAFVIDNSSTGGAVGSGATASGVVVVDGEGSRWLRTARGSYNIGFDGSGTLSISNGAVVDWPLTTASFATRGASSTAHVTVSGLGSSFRSGVIHVGGMADFSISNGGRLLADSSADLKGSGRSALRIGIGQYGPGTVEASTVVLPSDLEIELLDGIQVELGEKFVLARYNKLSSTFSAIPSALPTFDTDFVINWATHRYERYLEIEASSKLLAADFSGSGIVNSDDLGIWETNYGNQTASHRDGDADGNSFTNGNDFLVWQRQFGGQFIPQTLTTIPEPTTLGLVFSIVVSVGKWRSKASPY